MMGALRLVCLIALMLSLGADSWSKPPTPSHTQTTTQPEADASHDQKDATDLQPSAQQDAPITVEISKAPVIQVEAAEKTDEKRDYSSSEWWLVYFTFGLVVITGALATYTARLYRATVALGKEAKTSGADQAEKMERSVAATLAVAEAANKSASIAEDSFRRLERPYLFIKFTDMKNLRMPGASEPHLFYTLVNHGKLPAILRAVSIGLQFNPERPLRTTMASYDEFYDVIEPGQSLPGQRTLAVVDAKPGRAFQGNERTLLVLHGIIEYEDPTGALHIDSICMRCNRDDTFRIDGGSEYNGHKTEYPKQQNGKNT